MVIRKYLWRAAKAMFFAYAIGGWVYFLTPLSERATLIPMMASFVALMLFNFNDDYQKRREADQESSQSKDPIWDL